MKTKKKKGLVIAAAAAAAEAEARDYQRSSSFWILYSLMRSARRAIMRQCDWSRCRQKLVTEIRVSLRQDTSLVTALLILSRVWALYKVALETYQPLIC